MANRILKKGEPFGLYDGNQISSWDKCDWKPKEITEPKPAYPKLSEAIRTGADQIREGRCWLVDDCACALGTAAWALGYRNPLGNGHYGNQEHIVPFLSERYPSVPQELWLEVSRLHWVGKMNRAQLADWLESKGY